MDLSYDDVVPSAFAFCTVIDTIHQYNTWEAKYYLATVLDDALLFYFILGRII
jgi:hypothetical protein